LVRVIGPDDLVAGVVGEGHGIARQLSSTEASGGV
jgi:hypothetical protein